MHPEYITEMPSVGEWLKHAEATRRIVKLKYASLAEGAKLEAAIEENVLVQFENLQTHPAVAEAVAQGKLKLHAWVYDIATGEVFAYDDEAEQFVPLGDVRPVAPGPSARLADVKSGDAKFHAEP